MVDRDKLMKLDKNEVIEVLLATIEHQAEKPPQAKWEKSRRACFKKIQQHV